MTYDLRHRSVKDSAQHSLGQAHAFVHLPQLLMALPEYLGLCELVGRLSQPPSFSKEVSPPLEIGPCDHKRIAEVWLAHWVLYL